MKISEFSKWKDVSTEDWNDWQWQLRNRLRTLDDFDSLIHLTSAEREAFEPASSLFPAAATPYYALLMDADDPACPVRRQIMPSNDELIILPDELRDPLGEETYSPVPGLTHRYKDRALFYISHHCAHYCRHCNRRRKVGDAKSAPERSEVQAAMDYLREHDEIRDVLVSGGDPLSLSDKRLDEILGELRTISHIEIIRIATRMPVTLPQRVTPALVDIFKRYQPLYINTHFNHLKEASPEAAVALNLLADGGSVVGNQMVLLKGINDDPPMVRELNQWLLRNRCRPYYIFQCDVAEGVGHFRTPVQAGLDILQELRGRISGLAIPHYVVDLPGGGGKVPLSPDYLSERKGKTLRFLNYQGEPFEYIEG